MNKKTFALLASRLFEFELRLAPSDKLFLKVGESIRESEPIGEHDIQSDLEKLEERHRYEIEELLAETNEARRQQALNGLTALSPYGKKYHIWPLD